MLEIGSDRPGTLLHELKQYHQVKEVVGINLHSPDKEIAPGIYHLKKNAEETGFQDDQFDLVLSLAALEHLYDLPTVLEESFRIVKRGGTFLTLFGPIWSSAWGHHLWVTVDDVVYNYKNTALLPYCHLMSTPDEVYDYLLTHYEYPKTHCEKIVKYAFH